jgi:hypothetical protein
MLAKLNANQARADADRKAWREELTVSHKEMVAEIKPETQRQWPAEKRWRHVCRKKKSGPHWTRNLRRNIRRSPQKML